MDVTADSSDNSTQVSKTPYLYDNYCNKTPLILKQPIKQHIKAYYIVVDWGWWMDGWIQWLINWLIELDHYDDNNNGDDNNDGQDNNYVNDDDCWWWWW